MGTDIHGIMQAKINNTWVDVAHKYDEDRHYMLFAWLGNVRNGFGFAGVPTHDPLTPLSDCRGYPSDFEVDGDHHYTTNNVLSVSEQEWREKFPEEDDGAYWMGDHSHSYVTGEEILSAKLPIIVKSGVISVEQFKDWDGKSSPGTWCGDIVGPDVVVDEAGSVSDNSTHVRINWEVSVGEELKYFIDEIDRLVNLYGEVRYVFGFDS